jgi:uncharacterized LabA/DUF88 family protein
LADIRKFHVDAGIARTAKFNIIFFVTYFTGRLFEGFHGNAYKRFVFYFVQDDERLRSIFEIPDFTQKTNVGDIHIEYCGKRIRQFEQAKVWLDENNAPDMVRECLYRSEKAVDTQICCDALQLAAVGKLDRLFLYTNDYDYVPLCQTLKRMGANINLFRIRADSVNANLAEECDAFHVMDENNLRNCFSDTQEPPVTPEAQQEIPG